MKVLGRVTIYPLIAPTHRKCTALFLKVISKKKLKQGAARGANALLTNLQAEI